MTPILTTDQVTKKFGKTVVLDRISLQVNEGEIYGFLGLNGAGKTTLIRMLLGIIKPTSGSITLFHKKLHSGFAQWNDIGYLVETPYAYPNLSVQENLKIYYKLRQLKNPECIDEIIEKLKLSRYQHTQAKLLSLGNQQRLGLAKALMHRPRLLILDEPINGLDPEGIVEVRQLLKELVSQGSTVFLSSHILGEISKLANRIGIIHEGRLVKELTTEQLDQQLIKKLVIDTIDNEKALPLLTQANYQACRISASEIELTDHDALAHPERIAQLLVQGGVPPRQLYSFTEDLEMYFLRTIRPH